MRYAQLLPIIEKAKPRTVIEVGTWNGLRAIEMCAEALRHQDKVHYVGFDLFEANEANDERELNVKKAVNINAVDSRLREFQALNPGFSFELHKGFTAHTLADFEFDPEKAFVFIDGGHSISTIRHDYEALKAAKTVVLDDYYVSENGHPDITKFGCNFLLEDVKDAAILPAADPVRGGGRVQMVVIPRSAFPGKVNLVIKTQNCVPEDEIQANIRYSVPKIGNWIRECKVHDHTAVIVSGGPSLKDQIKEIGEHHRAGHHIFCVKHSHDVLIDAEIVPFGCFLLDPRDHVQDFIENPHTDINYFVASMCHPTTLDRLIERKARIIGYNAHVGAGEEDVLRTFGNHIMVGGGSTSATRGVSVLHTLGFRRFRLYGYDSCYYEEPDFAVKTKTGQQKYVTVEVSGKKFWSDLELVAQAQDFEKLMKQAKDLDIEVYGDGMIPHIWQIQRRVLPDFQEVLNA